MSDRHPTYPNPVIAEVVCDIHFRLPRGQHWKPDFLAALFNLIHEEYPVVQPVSEVEMQVEMSTQGVQQRLVPRPPKMRFKHISRPFLLHFAENNLTVNVTTDYPGWEQVLESVLAVWVHVRKVVNPKAITRIGLRYINHIPREEPNQTPGAWFRACKYFPEVVLASSPGFLYRAQVQLNERNRLIITTADLTLPGEKSDSGPFILDIDRIVEQEISVEPQRLSKELVQLHDHVWDVFSMVKTDKLTQLLERRG